MTKIELNVNIFSQIESLPLKSEQHRSFVLAYLCAVQYLWKKGDYLQNKTLMKDIKEMIGISDHTTGYNYIIKKGGLLEDYGLVTSVRDFPVKLTIRSKKTTMLSKIDVKKQKNFWASVGNSYNVKKPDMYIKENKDVFNVKFFDITEKEFLECLSTGGFSLLAVFIFIKREQLISKQVSVQITHNDITASFGFRSEKIIKLFKLLQKSSIMHMIRKTIWYKEQQYKENYFSVFSLLSQEQKDKLMAHEKKSDW